MRVMLILRGAPGSGKTSLVGELGLGPLALGFDRFRELFAAPVSCFNADGSSSATLRVRSEIDRAVAAYAADVTARVAVVNEGTDDATFDIEQAILDGSGKTIGTAQSKQLNVPAGGRGE